LAAWVFGAVEVDELLVGAELSPLCAVVLGAASADIGAIAMSTLSVVASQRVPVDTIIWGADLGENTTFIPQLYDGLGG